MLKYKSVIHNSKGVDKGHIVSTDKCIIHIERVGVGEGCNGGDGRGEV